MFSTFRERINGKTAGTLAISASALLGLGGYATGGIIAGWLLGLKVGSASWFAVLLAWPALPLVAIGLGLGIFGRGFFGHGLGDWEGDRYDY